MGELSQADNVLSRLTEGFEVLPVELSPEDENVNCETLFAAVREALHAHYTPSVAIGFEHTTRIVFRRALLSQRRAGDED